ncbi:MAG: amino acid ABC transporter ATP-binding protein [Burkholderiaceae bacterium]|nr:amino acid ABC transporter ATP-binding protein [Rhodoferax sp.]MCB2027254.1 amino acid ABC transporter ATP-binding protein [Rhodoferax sp.]MCB2041700.1 amino acid ABC transporter ATP-binding protein [Rhodoferax sp.]
MPFVELKSVVKRYGDNTVLQDVDLSIERGEIVAIIGRSGSGKSTLLRCINGLEPVQGGEVIVDGVAVHDPASNLRELRARVGIVFQSFNLFPHLTVERNITLGPTIVKGVSATAAAALAREALRKVGLEEKIAAYADELSGGQQQRVAIARSLAMAPSIMLFDEITSALDPELVGEVLLVLEAMARDGMTMLLVTHEMNFARRVAHRVVFMNQGKVWEQGPAREFFADPKTEELKAFLSSVLH